MITSEVTYKCDCCGETEGVSALGGTPSREQPKGWSRAIMVSPVLAAIDMQTTKVDSHLCTLCTDTVQKMLTGGGRPSVAVAETTHATQEQ